MTIYLTSKRLQRGLSLVELAIVLGVIGVILGGIWIVGGQANDKTQQEKLATQMLAIVNNVRGAYAGKAYFDSTNATTTMTALTAMNVFGAVIDPPFANYINPNGLPYTSIYVCGWRASGSSACDYGTNGVSNVPLFAVEVLIPTGRACINAVMQNASPAKFPGLVDVSVNGANANGGAVAPQGLPVKLSWVTPLCANAENASVSPVAVVDFVFRLTP